MFHMKQKGTLSLMFHVKHFTYIDKVIDFRTGLYYNR